MEAVGGVVSAFAIAASAGLMQHDTQPGSLILLGGQQDQIVILPRRATPHQVKTPAVPAPYRHVTGRVVDRRLDHRQFFEAVTVQVA